jgi:hypothetical protein
VDFQSIVNSPHINIAIIAKMVESSRYGSKENKNPS